jgi:predicted O-methyltransferase YrrM
METLLAAPIAEGSPVRVTVPTARSAGSEASTDDVVVVEPLDELDPLQAASTRTPTSPTREIRTDRGSYAGPCWRSADANRSERMGVERVKAVVGSTPHMSLAQANRMVAFMRDHEIRDVLELGFQNGVSTCYMAEQVNETGSGSVTTVDRVYARDENPNIEVLLSKLGLRHLVDVVYEPTSYTWWLMNQLDAGRPPSFDLCYIDGAHTWDVDGLAFFLVDRLLRPGGWIIFDDLNWTLEGSNCLRTSEWMHSLPEAERSTAQVRKIWDLLVLPHPGYGEFSTDGAWAFARKLPGPREQHTRVVVERVVVHEPVSTVAKLTAKARRLRR